MSDRKSSIKRSNNNIRQADVLELLGHVARSRQNVQTEDRLLRMSGYPRLSDQFLALRALSELGELDVEDDGSQEIEDHAVRILRAMTPEQLLSVLARVPKIKQLI